LVRITRRDGYREMVTGISDGEYDYSGDFEVKSEVAKVKIEAVYIDEAGSGALSFNVKFAKENGSFIDMQEWVK